MRHCYSLPNKYKPYKSVDRAQSSVNSKRDFESFPDDLYFWRLIIFCGFLSESC